VIGIRLTIDRVHLVCVGQMQTDRLAPGRGFAQATRGLGLPGLRIFAVCFGVRPASDSSLRDTNSIWVFARLNSSAAQRRKCVVGRRAAASGRRRLSEVFREAMRR
jgi:hypothetical protein